jgi:hypothetical protein
MKPIIKAVSPYRVFVILLLLSVSTFEGHAAPPAPWQVELCASLNELNSGNFIDETFPGIEASLDMGASSFQDSDAAIRAILEIFVRNIEDIELYWWESENRAARCFVIALYLCARDEDAPGMPEFARDITRFNARETQERRGELAFVLEYRSVLAGVLAEILQKRVRENYHSVYKDSFGVMAEAGLGKLLPGWCTQAKIENPVE